MGKPFEKEIDEHRWFVEAIRTGVTTPFWNALKILLSNWEAQAQQDLNNVDPKEWGQVARYQEQIRLYRSFVPHVEDIAREQDIQDKLKK